MKKSQFIHKCIQLKKKATTVTNKILYKYFYFKLIEQRNPSIKNHISRYSMCSPKINIQKKHN